MSEIKPGDIIGAISSINSLQIREFGIVSLVNDAGVCIVWLDSGIKETLSYKLLKTECDANYLVFLKSLDNSNFV